jgi:hypothetical protein
MSPYCWGPTFYGRNKFCNIVSLLMLVYFYRSDKYTGATTLSITTLSITTLSTIGLFVTLSITTLPLCWMSICWVPVFIYCYAECHCDEWRYNEWRYAEWSDANSIIAYYATELITAVKSLMIQAPGQPYFLIQTFSLVTPSLYTGGCLGAPSFFKDLGLGPWSSFFHMGLYIDVPSSLLLSFSLWAPLF